MGQGRHSGSQGVPGEVSLPPRGQLCSPTPFPGLGCNRPPIRCCLPAGVSSCRTGTVTQVTGVAFASLWLQPHSPLTCQLPRGQQRWRGGWQGSAKTCDPIMPPLLAALPDAPRGFGSGREVTQGCGSPGHACGWHSHPGSSPLPWRAHLFIHTGVCG